MKVLQSIGLYNLPVNENAVGGTEMFLYHFDKELTQRGIDSRVITWSESQLHDDPKKRRVIPFMNPVGNVEKFLHEHAEESLHVQRYAVELEEIKRGGYDLVHSHTSNTFRFGNVIDIPIITTIHMPPESFFNPKSDKKRYPNNTFVCVSHAQKELYDEAGLEIDYVIQNGIDETTFTPAETRDNYLLMFGRVTFEKGTDIAIEAAKKTGLDLIIAGSVDGDKDSRSFFDERIKPFVNVDLSGEEDKYHLYKSLTKNEGKIFYVGRVNLSQKIPLLSHAKAVLMPSRLKEGLSLVSLEALASGAPIIGYPSGGIKEVVINNKTGCLVHSPEEMSDAVRNIGDIQNDACRQFVLDNFTLSKMVDKYVQLYGSVKKV